MIYVTKAKMSDLLKIYKSYMSDFPKNERKPFSMLLSNAYITRTSDILVLKDNEKTVAYAITFKASRYHCVLVDYLATIGEQRSKGYGSAFMQELKKVYKERAGVIVEIEECGKGDSEQENIQRDRRKAFYIKNDFHMQPVHLTLFGVDMHIMYMPVATKEIPDFIAVMSDLYYNMFGEKIVNDKIKLENA